MDFKGIAAEVMDFLRLLILFLSIIVLLRMFVFANFIVSGESMANNFHDGDRLIISKLSYTIGEPQRFDVIVFKANSEQDYIKRVIGLPGEKIEYKDNLLYVNGQPIQEHYLNQITFDFTLDELLESDTVPQGHVFVLGDNRTNSADSRAAQVGYVPMENIIGKVSLRYAPFKRIEFGVSGNRLLN